MPKPFLFGVGLLVALAVLSLPAGVEAKPGYKAHPGGLHLILPVSKTGDHVISVTADDRQHVRVAIELPAGTIEYSTKGNVTAQRITAAFGALGRIDVKLNFARFVSASAHSGRCKGRGARFWSGTYSGVLELSGGEAGVPDVSTKHGQALFERRFRQVCKRQGPRPKLSRFPELEEGMLTVSGKGEGRTVRFWANIVALRRNPARSGGTVGAALYERREGVRITRRTGRMFFANALVMGRREGKLETVNVKPPQPFDGRAFYSDTPGSPASWTGELTVDLPGAEGTPLTGEGLRPILCRGSIDSCLYASDAATTY